MLVIKRTNMLKSFLQIVILICCEHNFIALGGIIMQGPLRGILAGAAAWKLGGGLISTIIIFLVVFWLLGKC